MRIAIIHGNDGSDVRIGKTCRSLSSMGFDVHFIGWDRRPGQPKAIDLGRAAHDVMTHPTPLGRATIAGQLRFARHVARALRRLRPDVACCVNEDCALMVLPLRGLFYRRLVCDVFDALADRHSDKPWPLRSALRAVSEIVRTGADRLIATDAARFERFGRFRRKTVVVENVPEDPGPALAEALPTGPAKVYVAGTLTAGRGLSQVLQAADRAGDVEVVSAGWPYDAFASDTFLAHPRVTFHGIVTAAQSLALAAGCDAVLCYYAPTSTNNLYASPNKVHDAMSVGRPVIINTEVRVSRWVTRNRLGWACPYDDAGALAAVLAALADRRARLPAFAARARRLFLAGRTWTRMEAVLRALYEGLSR